MKDDDILYLTELDSYPDVLVDQAVEILKCESKCDEFIANKGINMKTFSSDNINNDI